MSDTLPPLPEPCEALELWGQNLNVYDERQMHAYAAAALAAAEPVAYSVGRTLHWHPGRGVNGAQLYAAPPQREPLTRQQIDDLMTQHYPLDSLLRENVDAFEACVRDLERLHGIGA